MVSSAWNILLNKSSTKFLITLQKNHHGNHSGVTFLSPVHPVVLHTVLPPHLHCLSGLHASALLMDFHVWVPLFVCSHQVFHLISSIALAEQAAFDVDY